MIGKAFKCFRVNKMWPLLKILSLLKILYGGYGIVSDVYGLWLGRTILSLQDLINIGHQVNKWQSFQPSHADIDQPYQSTQVKPELSIQENYFPVK